MKEVVDNTSQQLEKETPETEVDKRTISQLEIPVTIKKRNEIRLNRTGFTIHIIISIKCLIGLHGN